MAPKTRSCNNPEGAVPNAAPTESYKLANRFGVELPAAADVELRSGEAIECPYSIRPATRAQICQ